MNISTKIEEIKSKWEEFWNQDSNQILIACLPLYFSWYPILLSSFENEKVRHYCYRSMFNTILFMGILIASLILSKIPVIGFTIANLFHLLGIFTYLGLSAFFIYNNKTEKKMDIALIENFVSRVDSSIT